MSERTVVPDDLRETVRVKYAARAQQVTEQASGCCEPGCCGRASASDPITGDLYSPGEAATIPLQALQASLGCGNPTALAELKPGETVLDLGSGGGIDVLLSARRVGPTGFAYGLDMTDEMLALARENQAKSGLTNVEFLRGEIEHIPLPDASVDVILSNCVINLSANKDQVFREAFRVLKPGGRFAVSDVVTRAELPLELRRSLALWVGCVAGALTEDAYLSQLRQAGFEDVSVEPTRVYQVEDARGFLESQGIQPEQISREFDGAVFAGFIRARKPESRSCCGPSCCA